MRIVLALLVFLFAATFAQGAGAITVELVPEATEVVVGASFEVELRANLDAPVLGWGLDVFTMGPVGPVGDPVIGPAWLPIESPDGDGLAAVAFPEGVIGDDVLLATLRYAASAPGEITFQPSATVADLTEGFALDPTGFAIFGSGPLVRVDVIPEPGTLLLVGAGLAGLAARGRRRSPLGGGR